MSRSKGNSEICYLSEEDLRILLEYVREQNQMHYYAFLLAAGLGLTAEHIVNMKYGDFNLEKNTFRAFLEKGADPKSVAWLPMPEGFNKRIEDYFSWYSFVLSKKKQQPLDARMVQLTRQHLNRLFKKYAGEAHIRFDGRGTDKSFKVLRHTFAMHWAKKISPARLALKLAVSNKHRVKKVYYKNYVVNPDKSARHAPDRMEKILAESSKRIGRMESERWQKAREWKEAIRKESRGDNFDKNENF